MRSLVTASALGLIMATPLAAHADQVGSAEIEALKQQVQALLQRVEELEARQADQAAQATKVEARVAEAEATNDNQTDQLAKTGAKVSSADWATRIRMKGDFRYRHENIDQENAPVRDRERIRARFGLDTKINDTLNAGFQIASGDDTDPRSTNATLTDANQRKGMRLDLAYVDWKAFDNAVATVGKQRYPWVRTGQSLFYDADVNPEGVSFKYGGKDGAFASVWGFWLSEASAGADANLFGGQVGYRYVAPWGGVTAFVMYNDYGAVQHSTVSFNDYPAGNTTYSADARCNLPAPSSGAINCLRFDYNTIEAGAQVDFRIGSLPAMAFLNYAENTATDAQLTDALSLGFMLGRADVGNWEAGVLYQKIEKDSLFGALVDSDFAGGTTQGEGELFRFGYGLAKGWTVNGQYYLNKRFYDTAAEVDYQRWQLDLNYKF